MKIKAADIARNLNLSKATVSLVLNNKPGVSEKTRRKVFDYIEEVTGEAERQKEEKNKQELENKNIIKVLFPFRYPMKSPTLSFGGIDSSMCI